MKILQPPNWPRPQGYANGVSAKGNLIFLSGIVGWNAQGKFEHSGFSAQVRQTLLNIVEILNQADAKPEHITRMTWYVLDKNEYLAAAKEDYLHSVSADPKFVNPYYGLTVLCAHEKNWPETLKYSAEVTKLNSMAYPLTNMYSGVANYYLGNYDAAESDVRAFEKTDTRHQHPDSSLLLSNILLAKHDYDASAKALEAYLVVVPNAANSADLTKQIKKLNEMSQAKKN